MKASDIFARAVVSIETRGWCRGNAVNQIGVPMCILGHCMAVSGDVTVGSNVLSHLAASVGCGFMKVTSWNDKTCPDVKTAIRALKLARLLALQEEAKHGL